MPLTPVTPVTVEALTSLHDLIKKELNDPSKDRIQRHVQKLASAAKISFAKQTLFQDQNRFLSTINNEAKIRRSTRSVFLGKAKVMSYKDLEEARAKCVTKETATASKGKRGRKCKRPALEAEAEAEAGLSVPKDKLGRISNVEPAKTLVTPWEGPSGADVLG